MISKYAPLNLPSKTFYHKNSEVDNIQNRHSETYERYIRLKKEVKPSNRNRLLLGEAEKLVNIGTDGVVRIKKSAFTEGVSDVKELMHISASAPISPDPKIDNQKVPNLKLGDLKQDQFQEGG